MSTFYQSLSPSLVKNGQCELMVVLFSDAVVSPCGLDSVLVGFDEKVLSALSRHVHPSSIVIDDSSM